MNNRITSSTPIVDFLSSLKNKDLIKDLASRDHETEICDKPTRRGHYFHCKAKGLSPGFTWFVGTDENGNYIEEWVG